jgi:RsiW-degrading membrane proteinase PrsW (M82 family)
MAIKFSCACGKEFQAKDELAGRRAKCPACGNILTIPRPAAAPAEPDIYGLADPDPQPAMRPVARPAVAVPSTYHPTSVAPKTPARAKKPGRPEPLAEGSSPREYLYWVLVLALVPLVFSVFGKGQEKKVEERLQATIEKAPPEVQQKVIRALQSDGGLDEETFALLPGGKLDEAAHLPRSTWIHWVYALIAAGGFWALALLLFPRERRTPGHLLLVGLFTGTIGIVLLLVVQFLAMATTGRWMTGRSIIVLLFYIAKFIGWSYISANDPDSNFLLSFVGFTCGVGLCEELCKALPLIGYYRRDARMGWRGAVLWGLASGVGFGVSEGIMYSSRFYNGVGGPGIYLVRFISCVALHALWSASVGITVWRRQEAIQGDSDWGEYSMAVLRILAVPMVLHGLYDTLLKKDMDVLALVVGAVSFMWFAWLVEYARSEEAEGSEAKAGWA